MTIKYVDKFILDQEEILIKDSRLDNVINDYLVCIGDSYGDGWDSDLQDSVGGWCDRIKNNLGLTTNVNFFTAHEGGSGFVGQGNRTGATFNGLLTNLANNMTTEQKEKVKTILVGGGLNDTSYTLEQIKNGVASFINNAKTLFPNAKVNIGIIAYSTNTSYKGNINEKVLPAYALCGNYGGGYISNSYYMIDNMANMCADGMHLKANGYQKIADYLTSYLKSNNLSVNVRHAITASALENSDDTVSLNGGNAFINNDLLQVFLNDLRIVCSVNNKTLKWDSWISVCKIETNAFKNPYSITGICPALVRLNRSGDTNWYMVPCAIRIHNNNELQIKCGGADSGINMPVSQINILQINITQSTILR